MSNGIHNTAVIEGDVSVGDDVSIGPYSVISGRIKIGSRTKISSNVRISGKVVLGNENKVYHGCCIGEDAQNWDPFNRIIESSGVIIGSKNTLREYVTIHRSSEHDGNTLIGDNNRFMVGVHIAHDCKIGSNITIINNTLLAGGTEIHNDACLGGSVRVNSFVRIGAGAFVSTTAFAVRDVPPFFVFSRYGFLKGIRKEKMAEIGWDNESINSYQNIFTRLSRGEVWEDIYTSLEAGSESIEGMLKEFLRKSKAGISIIRNQD